jgi:hypothetical protein
MIDLLLVLCSSLCLCCMHSSSPTKNEWNGAVSKKKKSEGGGHQGTKQPWVHHILHLVLQQNITERIVLEITHYHLTIVMIFFYMIFIFFAKDPNKEMNMVLGPFFLFLVVVDSKSHSLILKPLEHSCTRTQLNMFIWVFFIFCVHLFSSLGFLL